MNWMLYRTDSAGKGETALIQPEEGRHRGAELALRCPFHPDSHPSLGLNSQKKVFHCFACGASGVLRTEEASDSPRVPTPARLPVSVYDLSQRAQILRDAMAYFQAQAQRREATAYLAARGVSAKTAGWGYCPPVGQPLVAHMNSRGWSDRDLEEHQLVRFEDDRPRAILSHRILFTLTFQGMPVNLAGRSILPNPQRKWLFLRSFRGLPRGVFGEESLQRDRVILTESIFDALPWLECRRPALAVMGTSAPWWLLELLKSKTVLLALNQDQAGEAGVARLADRLRLAAREVRWIRIPQGFNDWNEYHCNRLKALKGAVS